MDYTTPTTGVPNTVPPALGAGMFLFFVLLGIAFYVYFAYCLAEIGKKTNTPNGWMAWVPIVNIFYMLQIARLPLWYFILMLIPLVNIFVIIYVWIKIAERRGRSVLWGILMIISPVNLVLLWFMAFREATLVSTSPVAASSPEPPVSPPVA